MVYITIDIIGGVGMFFCGDIPYHSRPESCPFCFDVEASPQHIKSEIIQLFSCPSCGCTYTVVDGVKEILSR